MVDELPGGEHRRHEFRAVYGSVEPALEQPHQVLAGVAAPAHRFLVDAAELAFPDIAVVALEPLLGHELGPIFRRLAPALAVLARTIFATVEGTLGPAPEIDLQAAIGALRHVAVSRVERLWFMSRVSGPADPAAGRRLDPSRRRPQLGSGRIIVRGDLLSRKAKPINLNELMADLRRATFISVAGEGPRDR